MVHTSSLFSSLETDKSRFLGTGDPRIIALSVSEIPRCFATSCEVDSVEVAVSPRKHWTPNFSLSTYKI